MRCRYLSRLILGMLLLLTAQVTQAEPQAPPPNRALDISANPTAQEVFRVRIFEEPLVPIGGEPTATENTALAAALRGYAKRRGPDDFSSLTGFLEKHPRTPWRAALLTDLGLEYYRTAHYSLALEAWTSAWELSKNAADPNGKAIADRAVGELACMYARLGHMEELEMLLKSAEDRVFTGPATELISNARGGLADMKERPEVSFRCGPLALQQIKLSLEPKQARDAAGFILRSASTSRGFSLTQVAELSQKVGLNLQMARRDSGAAFVVPSVVHWKVGHYAALVRQEGERYLLQDPTFRNDVWATKAALEAETSGYFLVPSGKMGAGWHPLDAKIGNTIWGKGNVGGAGPGGGGGGPPPPPPCEGMAVPSVDFLFISLSIHDEAVGYTPPVGPAVRFPVRYNQRDPFQPAIFNYSNLGPKWTFDWLSYITDDPYNPLADAQYYRMGGFSRFFTGFNPATQTYAYQQYDQTKLVRTSPSSYEMLSRDGSKLIFNQPDGALGNSRKVFLTQIVDPSGNAVTLTYDGNFRVVGLTDAIGQVTTIQYQHPTDTYKITKVTDPFGRFATFAYDGAGRLTNITDVIGLTSRFTYESSSDFINSLVTPYGTTTFTKSESGTTRTLETLYPDGSRERVEFNQTIPVPPSDPAEKVPTGMATFNEYHQYRNTFYWSRNACATGYGDYTKAWIYHWLHTEDLASAAGILESTKGPMENRVWYNYPGQTHPGIVGDNNRPTAVGRVLDDGSTQLYKNEYDGFGHLTRSIDPIGRTTSYTYSTNGIDLLEVRQTRAGNNELLNRVTYNSQHLPITETDAAGQTKTNTYNARGQLTSTTNPKGETTTYSYDTNGYLIAVDGPLPGTNDVSTASYDALGRTRTTTDVSGYTLTFEHDNMDRLTKVTHPDSTSEQFSYDRLDVAVIQDRAGRQTLLEFDNVQQMKKRTDPLGRVTRFEWCQCGAIKSLTDPMGRTTTWLTDVQSRPIAKQYGDGSQVTYVYEQSTSRLRQVIDEKQQVTQYTYNRDDTLKSVVYANTAVPTPGVTYTYDPNYSRLASMSDGTGATLYSYYPVTGTPTLGANRLASVDGPLPNDTITYAYDELGRRVSTALNGVATRKTYDAAGRIMATTNSLGTFSFAYDGASGRLLTNVFPNGLTVEHGYGGNLEGRELQRISHKVGATPISEFLYGRNVPADRITTWSQQSGAQPPSLYTFGYDTADQLLSGTVTNGGSQVNTFAYSYDPVGNRLSEVTGSSNVLATYNSLNQLSTVSGGAGLSRTNEWDAEDRLFAVNAGNARTEFAYNGEGRLASIRHLTNGVQVSLRRFVWLDDSVREERDAAGSIVTKRFFEQGMKIETGPNAGSYFYTRDHLGSVRELTDATGSVRARYVYDPYGRRTRLTGDIEADFGFTGMFFANEAGLALARFRAYDPELGRWLSRDPLRDAEVEEGPNLYAYAANNPVNLVDPLGLCCEKEKDNWDQLSLIGNALCEAARKRAEDGCDKAREEGPKKGYTKKYIDETCAKADALAEYVCNQLEAETKKAERAYKACQNKPCKKPKCPPKPKKR